MRRYKMYVDVTEIYEIIVDADDEEEAFGAVYEMSVDEIMQGTSLGSDVEITDYDEIPFIMEDN